MQTTEKRINNPLQLRKYAKTLALYQYCQDYHSGQCSKGYALVCALTIRLIKARIDTRRFDVREQMHKSTYKRLEKSRVWMCL